MSSVNLPNSVVATWSVGEKEVSVHKGQSCLTHSVKNGERVQFENRLIPVRYYNVPRAEVLIRVFREVIQECLADGISERSFLPVLCTEAWILREGRYVSTRFQGKREGNPIFF